MAKLTLDAIRGVVKEEVSAVVKKEVTAIVKEEVAAVVKQEVTTIVKEEIAASEKRLNEKITTFKQEILGEIEKLRTDNEVLSSHGDRLEDHDLRIERLEKPTPIPA